MPVRAFDGPVDGGFLSVYATRGNAGPGDEVMEQSAVITRAFVGAQPRIAIDVAGATGHLVVFVHGIGGNRQNWTTQLGELGAHYRAVALDIRGYGDSDDFDGPLSLDDICADIAQVIAHFSVPRATIVGLSMGGMIAQEFYRRYAAQVHSLILCSTNAGVGVGLTPAQKREFVAMRNDPLLAGGEPADLIPAMRAVLFGEAPSAAALTGIEQSVGALRKGSYMKAVAAMVEFDSSDLHARIDVPTLLIGGSHDKLIPLAHMQDMERTIPGAELTVLEGAGHVLNLEQPDAFNRAVRRFLARHGTS